ncbi:MBL fold metallo-hydrolase [Bacillaceae bacterium S4-13-56]
MKNPVDLGYDLTLIDLYDLSLEQRTGAYVFDEEDLTIIETSASPSIPFLLKGLEMMQLDPKDIKYIIVTHIHLDHAGGVGLLIEKCPNAKVIVHPRGKKHLADPTKLIQGAREVYGETFDSLFDPILPVPKQQLMTMEDGETLQIGKDRLLTFYDTPGHAKHHFSIHDSKSNGIFTGDTIGVLYPQTRNDGFDLVLPSTSPNQFDPDSMMQSLEKIEGLGVDRVYFGHFGMSTEPETVYQQIRHWLPLFVEAGEKVNEEMDGASMIQKSKAVSEELYQLVGKYLFEKGLSDDHEVYSYMKVDLQVCGMGIVDYLEKKK